MYRHNHQRCGVYKVRITLQYDDYKGYLYKSHLYCKDERYGEGVKLLFEVAEITQYDQINSDCDYKIKYLEDSYEEDPEFNVMFEAKLVNEKGETYLLNDYIFNLDNYITTIEIIECQEIEVE